MLRIGYENGSLEPKNISPNPSSKRGIEKVIFAQQKNLNPTTVSLFEEGAREMLRITYENGSLKSKTSPLVLCIPLGRSSLVGCKEQGN